MSCLMTHARSLDLYYVMFLTVLHVSAIHNLLSLLRYQIFKLCHLGYLTVCHTTKF